MTHMQFVDAVKERWKTKQRRYTYLIFGSRRCLAIRRLTSSAMTVFILYLGRLLESETRCRMSAKGDILLILTRI